VSLNITPVRDEDGSKGILKFPWSLHIGPFWKVHFIANSKRLRVVLFG
jgi:hypothetical protein